MREDSNYPANTLVPEKIARLMAEFQPQENETPRSWNSRVCASLSLLPADEKEECTRLLKSSFPVKRHIPDPYHSDVSRYDNEDCHLTGDYNA